MGQEGAALAEARLRGASKAGTPGRVLGGPWELRGDPSSVKVGGSRLSPI